VTSARVVGASPFYVLFLQPVDSQRVLRIRAVGQVGEGAHPEDVAAALGLHRKTVYGWLAKYREGGEGALRAQPVPGRPPKLGGPQLSRLYALIVGQDPRQMQFEFALWTREMVREVIRREFRVSLSVVSVGRLLRKLGLSPQRPARSGDLVVDMIARPAAERSFCVPAFLSLAWLMAGAVPPGMRGASRPRPDSWLAPGASRSASPRAR
jgi:transposase